MTQIITPKLLILPSSPLEDPHKLKIAFNIESLPPRKWMKNDFGIIRQGIATGWFASIANYQLPSTPTMVPFYTYRASGHPIECP